MSVILDALKFNHTPGAPAQGALAIRRNALVEVQVPGWQRTSSVHPEGSPAAYPPN